MEERVIDRYVIDTHPPIDTPSEDTPLEEETAAQIEEIPTESPTEETHEVSEAAEVSQVSEASGVCAAPEGPHTLEYAVPEPVEQYQEEDEPEVEEPVVTAQKVEATKLTARQPIEDEPEVMISSSWSAAADYDRDQLSGDDETIEREFAEALQHGDEASDVLSAEVSRSFEQENTGNQTLPAGNLLTRLLTTFLSFCNDQSERKSAGVDIEDTAA